MSTVAPHVPERDDVVDVAAGDWAVEYGMNHDDAAFVSSSRELNRPERRHLAQQVRLDRRKGDIDVIERVGYGVRATSDDRPRRARAARTQPRRRR
jgi:hypothetical protein